MKRSSRIYVAGGGSFTGRAILAALRKKGYCCILNDNYKEPDLRSMGAVDKFLRRASPEYVFLVAGRSAGIMGNIKLPATLMSDNLFIQDNLLYCSWRNKVKRLLYLASACCYPRQARQPIKEEYLLTGEPEPTSEYYAVAKLAGLKLTQAYHRQYRLDFICAIPANIFGPHDDFEPEDSHVIAAMMRKMHLAKRRGLKRVCFWGSGRPVRDFIFVDDLADACIFLMNNYHGLEPVNISYGRGVSIKQAASMVKEAVGFRGRIEFDRKHPDGMPAKVLSADKLRRMGWRPSWDLQDALTNTYAWFAARKKGKV